MHYTQRNSIALFLVHIGSCILLLTSGAHAIDGEPINNIRVFQPILRRSPAMGDTSAPADFFGWAAILHPTEVVNPDDSMDEAARKTRIIVGAPRGTFPGGLQLEDPDAPRAEQSGLVYNCPVRPGPCSGVRGDTDRYLGESIPRSVVDNNAELDENANMPGQQLQDYPQSYIEGRLFDQAPNAILYFRDGEEFIPAENKTGQLLGATLFSNSETFMACAPRWTDTRSSVFNLLPRGVCYTSGRDLTGFRRLQPCDQSGRTINTDGDGYCMAGTSALVSNGGFVIGAPLNDEGKGSLYVAPNISNPSFTSGLADIPDAVTGMGDPETRDQYQGFSTIAAFLTRRRDSGQSPDIVAAVPRYDDDTYTGRITVYDQGNFQALLTVNARGTQMAEFFGHSMIAVDINGDNYDDLVIGAPMNSDFGALKVERGRVYIFMNTGGGDLNSVPIIFNGLNPRGRFGTSLVNLGDIDDDGKEDFAVGAPYYAENIADSNTGAVYIYYGNSDLTAFETQVPFEITASDVVNNITGLNELRTFGFSVSGGVDVDNNQFNDLLVGAYDSQMVVLFRSLPVVNVTVDIDAPTPIALNSVFEVRVTAYYEGKGINRPINVPFTLSEDRPATADSRLKFDGDGTGTFTFSGPGMMNTQMITVTSLGNTTSLLDHMLRVTIPGGIDLPMTTTDGNQPLTDLSSYPRLRLLGNNTLAVSVTDPCGGNGCQFDVMLSPSQKDILVIANDAPVYSVDLTYNNAGSEDAVGLLLNFTGLSRYIRSVAIRRQDAIPSETPCSAITSGFASCVLRTRFDPGETEGVMVNFTIDQDSLTGNEANFSVSVAIASQTGNAMDEDIVPNNNAVQVNFGIVARADIAVSMLSFGGVRFDYTARAPTEPVTVQGLGRSTITLQVDIQNRGPTTIREGNITIYLANRVMDTQFTLYPSRIEAVNSPNGAITCDSSFVNPDGLPQGASQVGEGRRRRSASQHSSSSSLKRVTRQDTTVAHTCIGPTVDSGVCTVIQCTLSNLRRAAVPFTISVFTRIDERYFSSQPNPGTIYSLTTSASVSILSSFYGDDTADNSGQVTVELAPMMVESGGTDSGSLLHYILWPCIGGVLLLIVAAILLYFVGFFSRKKKPEDGEIEGDMDPDKIPMKSKPPPEESKEPSAPAGAEGADGPSETTKV